MLLLPQHWSDIGVEMIRQRQGEGGQVLTKPTE